MKKIIKNVLQIFHEDYLCHKYFNDGTSSKVILLNNYYLIKQNEKNILKAEIEFLNNTTSKLFQKILYIHPDYEFVVYKFINGETMKKIDNISDVIEKIILITKNYSNYNKPGFGYLNEEVDTWEQFLKNEINYSSQNLTEYISNNSIINNSIQILSNYTFTKKLLHGDLGTHNFIKSEGKLVGIIDPTPIIGDYLYDLLFALVSNVNILSNITNIPNLINEPKEKIDAMLIIVLYSRISRCLKYHPQDIDIYMNYWNKLIKEVKNGQIQTN